MRYDFGGCLTYATKEVKFLKPTTFHEAISYVMGGI